MNENTTESTDRWLTFDIASQKYAMSVKYVSELAPLRDVTLHQPPSALPHIAGIVNLRGQPIAVVDLRSALGIPTMDEETATLITMLNDRQADHEKWLAELRLSVQEEREFRLATDPHRCAFGKWYDELLGDSAAMDRFTNNDLTLHEIVDRFDTPHKKIHAIAEQVTSLAASGETSKAEAIITATRDTELNEMISLFGRARELTKELRQGVIAVVDCDNTKFGVLIDSASEVRSFTLDETASTHIPGYTSDMVRMIHDPVHGGLVQLLDASAIHDRWLSPQPAS